MNADLQCLSEEQLRHLFYDPPDPPELPAKRWPYHNGRRWKLETQGRANRRVRRQYRATMNFYYQSLSFDWQSAWVKAYSEIEREILSIRPSLYDFLMSRKA